MVEVKQPEVSPHHLAHSTLQIERFELSGIRVILRMI
jgi:hypothetical protein